MSSGLLSIEDAPTAGAYYAALAWTALASSYFMLKTMAQTVPTRTSGLGPRREFLVCGLGLIQGFSIWFLGFLFKGREASS